MAALGDVIEFLKGASVERLGTVLDHLQVKVSQSGYVGTVRGISDEIARLLGERPDWRDQARPPSELSLASLPEHLYDENRAGAPAPEFRTSTAPQTTAPARTDGLMPEPDPLAAVEKQAAKDWGVGSPQYRRHLAFAAYRCPDCGGPLLVTADHPTCRRCGKCKLAWFAQFSERDWHAKPTSLI